MPLQAGFSPATIRKNALEMVASGHPRAQAWAAAYDSARRHPHASGGLVAGFGPRRLATGGDAGPGLGAAVDVLGKGVGALVNGSGVLDGTWLGDASNYLGNLYHGATDAAGNLVGLSGSTVASAIPYLGLAYGIGSNFANGNVGLGASQLAGAGAGAGVGAAAGLTAAEMAGPVGVAALLGQIGYGALSQHHMHDVFGNYTLTPGPDGSFTGGTTSNVNSNGKDFGVDKIGPALGSYLNDQQIAHYPGTVRVLANATQSQFGADPLWSLQSEQAGGKRDFFFDPTDPGAMAQAMQAFGGDLRTQQGLSGADLANYMAGAHSQTGATGTGIENMAGYFGGRNTQRTPETPDQMMVGNGGQEAAAQGLTFDSGHWRQANPNEDLVMADGTVIPHGGGPQAAIDASAAARGGGIPGFALGGQPAPSWPERQAARDIDYETVHPGGLVRGSGQGGRTDTIPTSVAAGAYVIPADVVSGLGQGDTLSGSKVLSAMFNPGAGPFGMKLQHPGGAHTIPHPPAAYREGQVAGFKLGGPPGTISGAHLWQESHFRGRRFAHGGDPHPATPVKVADGEFIVSPDALIRRFGDLKRAHAALDKFVLTARKKIVGETKNLPGPVRD